MHFRRQQRLVLLVPLFFALSAINCWAVPQMVNYQGMLTDNSGNPVSETLEIEFLLYTALSGGVLVWSETQPSVDVIDGVFNVRLGTVSSFSAGLFDDDLYLGIAVDGGSEMTPRHELVSVPYALTAENAEALGGYTSDAFSLDGHEHDDRYYTESETNSLLAGKSNTGHGHSGNDITSGTVLDGYIASTITRDSELSAGLATKADFVHNHSGGEITSGTVADARIAASIARDSEIMPTVLANDGPGSTLDADYLDNYSSSSFVRTTQDYGRSGVSSNLYEDTSTLTSKYVNVTGDTMNGSVSGGLLTATNTSTAGSGFAGYCYAASGSGVFGQGAWNGIYGYSNSTGSVRGVYGVAANTGSYTNYGGYFTAAGTTGRAVYGSGATGGYFVSNGATGRGVYAYASGTNGYGIYAASSNGDGIYGGTGASDEHAGYFSSSVSAGLAGAALYARASNSTADGIALWAHNDHTTSTDATLVSSNDGSGPLFKGFGGDGGNDEFRIDNNGSIHVYDPTIADDVLYFNSTNGYLYLGSGSSTTTGDDGDLIILDSDGTYAITLNGEDGRTTTRSLQITGGSDLSEHFDIDKHLNAEPGMLVSIDPVNPGKLSVSSEPYDRKVAGIISGAGGIKTGLMMGQHESIADGAHPVALTGRVYCMADTSQGTIEPGDLLTSSATPGHAMKVTDHSRAVGAIIGKAMTPLTEGEGLVLVLVSLQ